MELAPSHAIEAATLKTARKTKEIPGAQGGESRPNRLGQEPVPMSKRIWKTKEIKQMQRNQADAENYSIENHLRL